MARAGLDASAVVDAAVAIADGEGLERLTLAALAQRLGVRVPSLYNHVDGLADLRARLAIRGCDELRETLGAAAAGRAGADALHAVADAYRTFALARPGTYAIIQLPHRDRPDVEAAAARVAEVVFAVMRGYGLEGVHAVHGVRAVRAAVHGFVSLQQQEGFRMPVSPDDSWERLLAMLDGGLRTVA
jgi:AcrR family transcriptional regulator